MKSLKVLKLYASTNKITNKIINRKLQVCRIQTLHLLRKFCEIIFESWNCYLCLVMYPSVNDHQSISPWSSILSVAFLLLPIWHSFDAYYFFLEFCLHSCIKLFEWRHVCENFPEITLTSIHSGWKVLKDIILQFIRIISKIVNILKFCPKVYVINKM